MLTRRTFSRLSVAALLTQLLSPLASFADDSKLTVNGDFGFKFQNGSLTMNVKDVTIDGLSIPAFSWKWIGLGIAQGILAGFGGLIFNALSDAIFGHQGKSIEQLLKEQLVEIAQIVQDALMVNNLHEYQAEIDAYGNIYREFLDTKTIERLDFLLNNSQVTLSRLSTTGFSGYRTYMIGAGLRLAALRDEMKIRHTSPKSFKDQRQAALEFHNSVAKTIEDQTKPAAVFQRFNGGAWGYVQNFRYESITNQKILSEPLNGIVIVNAQTLEEATEGEARLLSLVSGPLGAGPNFSQWVSLARIREKLQIENTVIGDKIIARWNRARLLV